MTGLGSSCGACKFLRRRCTSECVFAPYFCYDQAANHFAAVHKVFGASNVSKLLLHLPVHVRCDAAVTISYEALARVHDPVYGCIAHIFALEQQVACLKEEIETIGKQIASTRELQSSNYVGNAYIAAAQLGMANNCANQQDLYPTPDLPTAFADETWCSWMELQQCLGTDQDQISQEHFDSNIFGRLFEELNQDYHVHMIS